MRLRLVLAAAVLVGLGAPAMAGAQQAPEGHASAVAAEIAEILAIARTEATAGPNGNEATANALELGGEPPSEQFGGTQKGTGSSKGALIDTGDDPNFSLKVTPWSADVDERSAVAKAALARLRLADAVAVDVLQSESAATYDGSSSAGKSSSDGGVINLGGEEGLTIVVLHSEASSSGEGESYLLAINENKILTSEDANGACLIEIPDLARITCLTAEGGAAGDAANQFEATVLRALVGGEEGLLANVVSAAGSGGSGSTGSAAGAEPAPGGVLPFTGGRLGVGVAGLMILALGLVLARLRERTAAAA